VARFAITLSLLGALVLWLPATPSRAAQPSDILLPNTTKGYVSIQDVDLLRAQFEKTQLSKLLNDPLMKPFVEDVRKQIESKIGKTDIRLNIKLDDLKGVHGGEVCLAVIQPGGDVKQHALALLVDVTGHLAQANALLAKIDKQLQEQKAKRTEQKIDAATLVSYELPKKRGATVAQRAFYFVHQNQLVATDHEATAKEILSRLGGNKKDALKDFPAFKAIEARCKKAFGETPAHIRWFVEPFGYAETMRAAAGGRKKRGTDPLKLLRNQGFDAIKGLGGYVSFSVNENEAQHGTFIYAPPVNKQGDKYNLAARMLDFPESNMLDPQDWVPDKVTNYITMYWEMEKAFESSKTLVDEAAGGPVFDDVIKSLKEDPHGPRVDLRKDLVQQLGKRVTFFSDYQLPISPTCERWLLSIEVTNAPVVAGTLGKIMAADPAANKRIMVIGEDKQEVWEISREEAPAEVEELDIGGPGFGEFGDFEEEEEEEEAPPLLDHAAFTVIHGHLMIASHFDFLQQVLAKGGAMPPLSKAQEYIDVAAALKKLGAGQRFLGFFTRTDKAYHVTYELIRQGKMPESKSLFGNVLNGLLGPEEEGVLRKQQIDGTKMPEFEKIRHNLGPAGAFVDAEDDGWFITGCLLKKQAANKPADKKEAGEKETAEKETAEKETAEKETAEKEPDEEAGEKEAAEKEPGDEEAGEKKASDKEAGGP